MTENLKISLFFSCLILIIIAFAFFYLFHLIKKQKLLVARFEELTDILFQTFILGNIKSVKDLLDLVKGYNHFENLRLSLPWDLLKILNRIKLKCSLSEDAKQFYENINTLIKDLEIIIEEEKIKLPFERVPTIERNLLIDILEFSGKKNEILFRDKLNRLGELIEIRQTTMEKLASDSTESLNKSKLSIILAVIFFIISTILTIYSFFK